MHDPVPKQQWEVRVADKKGWQVRMAYYDRLLRSLMEIIEATVEIMNADGMSDEVEDLGKALLAIEDAWTRLALEKSSALIASESGCNSSGVTAGLFHLRVNKPRYVRLVRLAAAAISQEIVRMGGAVALPAAKLRA